MSLAEKAENKPISGPGASEEFTRAGSQPEAAAHECDEPDDEAH